ncbi:kinase/pyrophosphorylase, partial [Enterococcus faecalis]|uniref:kinase/pyrophosphorylase n=1 Tax=Enterococcus faecalis TaxID=1351 RepID=UPI003CC5FABE
YVLPENTSYSDIEIIRRVLAFANDLYQKLGSIVIDVASHSIEETASMILNALNLDVHSYYYTETSED